MKYLSLGFVFASLLTLTSCKSNSGSTDGASTSSADYPFDEHGNYRPEFLASHGHSSSGVVDLTKDNPPSPFLGTTGPDAWASSNRSSSTASKPKSSSSSSSRYKTTAKTSSKTSKKTVAKAPPKKPAPKYSTITIKKGDTLYGLSLKHRVSVGAIQAANGMGSSTMLRDGKTLKIPAK